MATQWQSPNGNKERQKSETNETCPLVSFE